MNAKHDLTKITDLINIYETTTDAKTRYKSASQLCRLIDRNNVVGMIYGKQGMYISSVEHKGEYRIPRLDELISQRHLNDLAKKHNLRYLNSTVSFELTPGFRSCDIDYNIGRFVGVSKESVLTPESIEKAYAQGLAKESANYNDEFYKLLKEKSESSNIHVFSFHDIIRKGK